MNREKYEQLLDYLKDKKRVMIAFSGGVDSTFLLKAAQDALGDQVKAVTIKSPYIPEWEIKEAEEFVAGLKVDHEIVAVDHILESIMMNPKDRCYLCKTYIFGQIMEKAKAEGYDYVCDGSNLDDTKDYRPGMVALKELGVISPLLECGWTKSDIRAASAGLNLPTWNKPPYACLLTRLPYDQKIGEAALRQVEKAEVYMMSRGFKAVRVRHHGDLARIEVDPADRERLFDIHLWDDVAAKLKEIGFTYVTFDASGYKMGSFNETIL